MNIDSISYVFRIFFPQKSYAIEIFVPLLFLETNPSFPHAEDIFLRIKLLKY